MLLTNTLRKVITLMRPNLLLQNNAEGICSDRATILGKERQNFNSKQQVRVHDCGGHAKLPSYWFTSSKQWLPGVGHSNKAKLFCFKGCLIQQTRTKKQKTL